MGKFIMLVGLPGSGKSTLAQKLLQQETDAVILSSDTLRQIIYHNDQDQEHNKEIFDEMLRRTLEALKNNKTVIYDATNINSKKRIHTLNMVSKFAQEKICYLLATPYERCVTQNTSREKKVPLSAIRSMLAHFQSPHITEGFDTINIIYPDNLEKAAPVLPTIFSKESTFVCANSLEKFIDPRLEHLKKYYPYYDNTTALYWAVYLYDIGKDLFQHLNTLNPNYLFTHENISTYIVFYYNIPEHLKLDAAFLISRSVRLKQSSSDKVLRDLRKMSGEILFNELMILSECTATMLDNEETLN